MLLPFIRKLINKQTRRITTNTHYPRRCAYCPFGVHSTQLKLGTDYTDKINKKTVTAKLMNSYKKRAMRE